MFLPRCFVSIRKSLGCTTVDLDAPASLPRYGLEDIFLQLKVTDAMSQCCFGNLWTAAASASTTRYTFGAPRPVIGAIHPAF